jgi:hypothetical protein
MTVINVFKADNGDVFFEHDGNTLTCRDALPDITALSERAGEIMEKDWGCIPVHAVISKSHTDYYLDGSFLASADLHVSDFFDRHCSFVYLVRKKKNSLIRQSKRRDNGGILYEVPLSIWADRRNIKRQQAINMAERKVLASATRIGKSWFVDAADEPNLNK